jgi:hypothetical protein
MHILPVTLWQDLQLLLASQAFQTPHQLMHLEAGQQAEVER